MRVIALGFASRALDRTLGTRVTVVVVVIIIVAVVIPIIVPIIVVIIVPIIVVIIIAVIIPVVVFIIVIVPIIIITMPRLIPILRDTSLTQWNQRRRLLPFADTLSLRRVTVMHRVTFVRNANYRTADLPAAVGDVVAVEGVG